MVVRAAEHERERRGLAELTLPELVEEQLQQPGVGGLERRGGDHQEVGGLHDLLRLRHLRITPSEERGSEVDDVDDVLRRNAGQLLGDQLRGGTRPRHRLGISYHYDRHVRILHPTGDNLYTGG